MGYNGEKNTSGSNTFLRWLGRMVVVAIILGVTSFLTPGFTIYGLWSYLIAAVVISALDYFVESFMDENISPFGKGIKGFLISAVIIYVAQFFVPYMGVSIIGAILAAVVIGILDAIFPIKVL